MFTLRNEIGNVYREVATEKERNRLLENGYMDIDAEKAKAKEDKKAGKVAKEGDAK